MNGKGWSAKTFVQIPEGWTYEPVDVGDIEDPFIGIFGDIWYHDSCAVGHMLAEAKDEVVSYKYEGSGYNRIVYLTRKLTCPDCHTEVEVEESEYDPDDSDYDEYLNDKEESFMEADCD